MGVIQLIVLIALLWLIVYAVKTLIPMEATGQKAVTLVALVVTVLLVLSAFGLLPVGIPAIRLR